MLYLYDGALDVPKILREWYEQERGATTVRTSLLWGLCEMKMALRGLVLISMNRF